MAPPRLTDLAKTTLKIVAAILIVSFVAIPIGFALAARATSAPPPAALIAAIARVVLVVCIGWLIILIVRAAGWRRALIGAVVLIVLAGALWVFNTTVWRDDEYRRVTAAFKEAEPFPKQADIGGRRGGWNETIVTNARSARARAPTQSCAPGIISTSRPFATRTNARLASSSRPPTTRTFRTSAGWARRCSSCVRSLFSARSTGSRRSMSIGRRLFADRRVDLADVR
jgi:hypothetical protein